MFVLIVAVGFYSVNFKHDTRSSTEFLVIAVMVCDFEYNLCIKMVCLFLFLFVFVSSVFVVVYIVYEQSVYLYRFM